MMLLTARVNCAFGFYRVSPTRLAAAPALRLLAAAQLTPPSPPRAVSRGTVRANKANQPNKGNRVIDIVFMLYPQST